MSFSRKKIETKKKKVGGGASARERRDQEITHAVVFLSFLFFFDLPNTQAGEGDQGQRDGDGARVRRKENKDRTQSNQQQLNA